MAKDMFSLTGKVAVVSGATGVLAGASARHLCERGAKVAFLGRDEKKLSEAEDFASSGGYCAIALKCDVLDKKSLEAARERILGEWGSVDILVNGAGGNASGATVPPDSDVFSLDISAYRGVVDLNLTGTLLPTLVFGECFKKSKMGVVVNFSSMSADRPLTRVLGYSNAKAAVENLTKWLAVEFAQKIGEGVRVNAIAPGFFLSSQNRSLLLNPDSSPTSRGRDIIRNTPFGRFGNPEEIFGALVYLCSDASKFVTGVVIPVDGGFSAFAGV